MIWSRLMVKVVSVIIDHLAFQLAQLLIHRTFPRARAAVRRAWCFCISLLASLWRSASASLQSAYTRARQRRLYGADRHGVIS